MSSKEKNQLNMKGNNWKNEGENRYQIENDKMAKYTFLYL